MMNKTCCFCKETKDISLFGKDLSHKDGLNSRCKICYRDIRRKWRNDNRIKLNARRVFLRKQNPNKRLNSEFKFRYNITVDYYNNLVLKQNGLCFICNTKPNERLYIDHNHSTGKIRGLLCKHCNFGLGHFRDNINLLNNAIKYLNDNQ